MVAKPDDRGVDAEYVGESGRVGGRTDGLTEEAEVASEARRIGGGERSKERVRDREGGRKRGRERENLHSPSAVIVAAPVRGVVL